MPLAVVVAGVAAYVAVALAAEPVRRGLGRRGHIVIGLMLLVDGIALAFAMYATGGTQSPMRFLIYLHLVAVSLLCSYRTGLKVALWDSLLLFVVLYAQAAALVPAGRRPARRGRSSSTGCRSSTSRRSGCSRSRRRSSRR